jgi:hypothetical protein
VAPGAVGLDVVGLDVAPPGAVVPGAALPGVPPEVVAPGVPLAELAGGAVPVPPGENDGGAVEGVPDVHADTDAVASMATAAQPRAIPRKRRRP